MPHSPFLYISSRPELPPGLVFEGYELFTNLTAPSIPKANYMVMNYNLLLLFCLPARQEIAAILSRGQSVTPKPL